MHIAFHSHNPRPERKRRIGATYARILRQQGIAAFISLFLALGALVPAAAHAGVIQGLLAMLTGIASAQSADDTSDADNIQTLALPTAAMNIDPSPATGGGGITIVSGMALMPEEGPSGTLADIEKPANGTISVYVVQPGDTLSSIAQLFGVPVNTIRWANDIPASGTISPGEKLTILPIPGLIYTVRSGDTLASIAKKYGGDAADIASYNGIGSEALAAGSQIIVPNGEVPATLAQRSSGASGKTSTGSSKVLTGPHASCDRSVPDAGNPAEPSHGVGPDGTCAEISYYIAPLSHYIQTQGIHGYNAVDLAAPARTPVMAAAAGTVIVARQGGWNGGYGSYVVVQHGNGSQTLYAHLFKVAAYDGERVVQGQVIGSVGESGEATGPHVHFEIRNGIRNPF